MASILTNSSALTALQTLSSTNKSLETTQNRISTGLKVAGAADNAAYWSIATTMRSDNKANAVVQDSLALGSGKIDTAYAAMNKAIDVMDQIKEKVLLAKTSSEGDRAKIQSEIEALQSGLKDTIQGASYAGANLLETDGTATDAKFTVISSYNRSADASGNTTVKTGTIDVALNNTRLMDTVTDETARKGILDTQFGVTAIALDAATGEEQTALTEQTLLTFKVTDLTAGGAFDEVLGKIENALGDMATGAAALGAAQSRIDIQQSFISSLSDSIEKGVGQLVDADMNKESARLSALQVQQQLGVQALSIANSSNQNILSLFR